MFEQGQRIDSQQLEEQLLVISGESTVDELISNRGWRGYCAPAKVITITMSFDGDMCVGYHGTAPEEPQIVLTEGKEDDYDYLLTLHYFNEYGTTDDDGLPNYGHNARCFLSTRNKSHYLTVEERSGSYYMRFKDNLEAPSACSVDSRLFFTHDLNGNIQLESVMYKGWFLCYIDNTLHIKRKGDAQERVFNLDFKMPSEDDLNGTTPEGETDIEGTTPETDTEMIVTSVIKQLASLLDVLFSPTRWLFDRIV